MTGRRALRMGAWWAAYVVAVVAGRQLVMPETGLSLIWPAAGIAALWFALIRGGVERLVASGLLLATVAVVITQEIGAARGIWWAGANLVQALVVADLLRRWPGLGPEGLRHLRELTPTNARQVLTIAWTTLLASVVGAVVGTTGALLDGVPWSSWLPVGWVVRNGGGMFVLVVVVSMLLSTQVASEGRPWQRVIGAVSQPRAALELVVCLTTGTAATVAIFSPADPYAIAFLALPSAVWLGMRFVPAVATLNATLLGLGVIVLTLAGRGPFAGETDMAVRAITVQLFFLLFFALALLLSIAVQERQQLLHRMTQSEAEARERADVVSAVTRTMHDGLLVVDASGRAVMSNPAARALLGPQAARLNLEATSEVDGTNNADGTPMAAEDRPALRALRGETVDQVDLFRVDPATGASSVLSCSAAPMTGRSGERLAVLVLSDVTEERARMNELRGFAGVVAHDLKGPIAGVRGWSEILDEQLDDLDGDRELVAPLRSTLQRMQASAERAQDLIDDLLAYAQAGSAALDLQPTTLAEVWAQARRQLPPTTGTGSEIRFVRGDDAIEVDVVLVRQLLVNLVGNSMKYVAAGVEPRVRISSRVVGDRLHVEVTDNGIGIPREEQAAVFDGFVRSSRSGAYPGTGIGLAICARAVQRHGGVIGARDAGPDGGTRISFTLPRPAETAVVPEVPPAPGADAIDGLVEVPLEDLVAAVPGIGSHAEPTSVVRVDTDAADVRPHVG